MSAPRAAASSPAWSTATASGSIQSTDSQNGAREIDGNLRWDVSGLYAEILAGLRRLRERYPHVESIGIDTWGVDYGLLDTDGQLLAAPIAYRDGRTTAVIDEVLRVISPDELFAINGLQFLPFNTIYQLAAEKRGPHWSGAAHVVLLAGPTEATALGNVLIQARAHRTMPPSLEAMRACIARSMPLRRFDPR